MERERSRRAVLGAMVGAGVAGSYLSPVGDILEQFAPFSGSVWRSADPGRPETVESPYGEATIRYDDHGVPQIEADDELALYYAVGHAQAIDRGFQMDLQRRLIGGELAAIVGEDAVESDRFHRRLCFREAAEATAEHLEDTAVGPMLEAFSEGVTAGFEDATLEVGFQLLDYEPDPWTPADSMLVEKLIAWQLTGSFRTLRKELVEREFGAELTDELFRNRMEHDAPIIRNRHRDEQFRYDESTRLYGDAGDDDGSVDIPTIPGSIESGSGDGTLSQHRGTAREGGVGTELVDYLTTFEPIGDLGSNSWVIGEELAAGDGPILSNDPHLSLQAPPIWYEMHLDGPDHRVRGVAFPGVPEPIIGESEFAAWGFTNAGSDVIDFYEYNSGHETYRYDGERMPFDEREERIEVDGGDDETVTIRKTVHGPVIEEAEQEVAVAWTGHAATETTIGIYELTRSQSFEETVDAIRKFEAPTQNFLYADQDGNTLYATVGRHPVRRPSNREEIGWDDPDALRGDQVFNGTITEGEWGGFEPFTRPSWDDFIPFEELPHVVDPDYLGTANQQIIPDEELPYYFAESYNDPYRGERLYKLLDRRVESGDPIDLDFLETVGRDIYDGRAASLVDHIVDAVRDDDVELLDATDTLSEWDYRMDHESRAPLLFHRFMHHYREELLGGPFEEVGLDEEYYPRDGRIVELPPDSRWFGPGGRAPVLRRALREAVAEIDRNDEEQYGDIAHTGRLGHLTQLPFLGYDSIPRSGSGWTLWNFGLDGPWGGGWEMQVDLDGEYRALLAGGNSGRYYSPHYDDQLEEWAAGEYRTLSREIDGELETEFVGGNQ